MLTTTITQCMQGCVRNLMYESYIMIRFKILIYPILRTYTCNIPLSFIYYIPWYETTALISTRASHLLAPLLGIHCIASYHVLVYNCYEPQREIMYRRIDRKTNPKNQIELLSTTTTTTTTTTTSFPAVPYLIHSLPGRVNKHTSSITLILSKLLVSLAFDHGVSKQHYVGHHHHQQQQQYHHNDGRP